MPQSSNEAKDEACKSLKASTNLTTIFMSVGDIQRLEGGGAYHRRCWTVFLELKLSEWSPKYAKHTLIKEAVDLLQVYLFYLGTRESRLVASTEKLKPPWTPCPLSSW